MSGICDGRVVVVTGAGRGIGKAHALGFAREGARVVVNDLGGAIEGGGSSSRPADEVVSEIRALGGEAVPNTDDVADWEAAHRLVQQAVDAFGTLDVLVNNAGVHRSKMIVDMGEDDWDTLVRVNLKGTFCPTRAAAAYWRDRIVAGNEVDARVICTTSQSGLYGRPAVSGYGAAKAGVAAFVTIAAQELARYGVTVNAIAPRAVTRMWQAAVRDMVELGLLSEMPPVTTEAEGTGRSTSDSNFDSASPEDIAPFVVWLGSTESRVVTGRLFEVTGEEIAIVEGWGRGPSVSKGERWEPSELGPVIDGLLTRATEPLLQPTPEPHD